MVRKTPSRATEPERHAVTILDVAKRAGVSTATVSRALAMPDQVAEATRARVFAAIEETGFTPNATARSLRAKSTKMVLVLLPGLGNSFWTVIINAVEEVLTKEGYGVIFGDTRNDPWRENHYDQLVRGGQVDGVLLFTGRLPREGFALLDRIVPITLVCNEIVGVDDLPLFEVNNRDSARMMTEEYLIGLGHRRIAHVTGPDGNVEARERIVGYSEALTAAGIPVDGNLIWPGSFDFDAGSRAAERYRAAADKPTAIFTGSDEIAIALMKGLKDGGVRNSGGRLGRRIRWHRFLGDVRPGADHRCPAADRARTPRRRESRQAHDARCTGRGAAPNAHPLHSGDPRQRRPAAGNAGPRRSVERSARRPLAAVEQQHRDDHDAVDHLADGFCRTSMPISERSCCGCTTDRIDCSRVIRMTPATVPR